MTVEVAEKLRAQLAALEAVGAGRGATPARSRRSELAWGSTADWFTHLAGTHRGAGHRTVRQAGDPGRPNGPRPTRRCSPGRVSPEQAAVIVDAVDQLPLDPASGRDGEAVLLDEAAPAQRHRPGQGRPAPGRGGRPRRGRTRRPRRTLDRRGPGRPPAAGSSRSPRTAPAASGSGAAAASRTAPLLKAALLPLTKPAPAVDPGDLRLRADRRTRATTAPGCGTPWSRPASTPWTPTCPRPATAPGPGSRSPPASRCCAARSTGPPSAPAASRSPTTASSSPPRDPAAGLRRRPHPVVLGSRGEVLDVGRTHRLVTPRDLARPGLPRPPLRLPRLHPTTGDVPRPPHPPLGRRRRAPSLRQPGPALRPPPPRHPPHPLAGPAQPRRRQTRVPPTRKPGAPHSPPGSAADPDACDEPWARAAG